LSLIGRAPSETRADTRQDASWPPAVAMVTPCTAAPATPSARSTARAMTSAASSMLAMAAPLTPRDWT
jgi:hypothetical protein